MPVRIRLLFPALAAVLTAAAPAAAQSPAVVHADSLRTEWSVEPARAGRTRVVGYLHNGNLMDAANVWIRVDRLGPGDTVAESYRRRVVGDVLAGGRSLFEVPVGEAGARYRVTVEAADWVKECR